MRVYILLSLAVLAECTAGVSFGKKYEFSQTVKLSDKNSNPVNYQIRATALIEPVHHQLLSIKLTDQTLFTHSKKSDGFKKRKSILDVEVNYPFFTEIVDGVVQNIYIADSERLPILNLKKSLSSLLQFQTSTCDKNEIDVSGNCKVKYVLSNDAVIQKIKSECETDDIFSKENVWSGNIVGKRIGEIVLSEKKLLESVLSKEEFGLKANIADFIEVLISTSTQLQLIEPSGQAQEEFSSEDIQSIITRAGNKLGIRYVKSSLLVDKSLVNNKEAADSELTDVLKENSHLLTDKNLGSSNSAIAALKVLKAMKNTMHNDVYNSLKSKKNKKIIAQLLDILGAVQTSDSHKAAMKFLKFNSKDYNLDLCERYLWSLSTSVHHEKEIIKDLLKLMENEISDKKLLETLVQTVSSMVQKYGKYTKDNELLEVAFKLLSGKLKKCSKEDYLCMRTYLKSFTNIGSPKATDLLVEHAVNGPKSIGPYAMRGLWKLGPSGWNNDVLKAAERVFLSNGTYDSSAKTIALDILLESSKSTSSLSKLIQILKRRDVSKELKEYLLQRLAQLSEKDKDIKIDLKSILASERLYQYDAIATGGLSTAFDRPFMKNGYLSTAQEVKSGILKQGYVHINLESSGVPQTVFTLGLFSNGLGSFVSDDSGNEEDESTNAGLELTVMGVEFRPFVFFEGHGELMGHVFSGAGSTITPAYQALLLLEEKSALIVLATGDLLKIKFYLLASVDLSGKIEISLWSRTAESLVQNSAGVFLEETVEVISPYINSQMKMELSANPQLMLSSNIEFYNKVALCLTLEQPQVTVQYNTSATTNIIGSTYNKSYIKKKNITVPGKTYALNSKNNEMCNILFQGL